MKVFALRLTRGTDLKQSIINFTVENNIKAGFILSCVGSLQKVKLRMANENLVKEFDERFEIIALSGTLCLDGVHLHIGLSDENGKMFGGHLLDKCIIYTTAEIVIGLAEDKVFSRKFDNETGFSELVVSEKP